MTAAVRGVRQNDPTSLRLNNAYKSYLFQSKNHQATDEGVLGPEVTFMGKSIPLITAAMPAVAGVAGAGFGARRAASRNRQLLSQRGMSPEDRAKVDNESLKSILKYGAGATAGAAMAGQGLESLRRQAGSERNFNYVQSSPTRLWPIRRTGFKALGAAPGLNYEAEAELALPPWLPKRR